MRQLTNSCKQENCSFTLCLRTSKSLAPLVAQEAADENGDVVLLFHFKDDPQVFTTNELRKRISRELSSYLPDEYKNGAWTNQIPLHAASLDGNDIIRQEMAAVVPNVTVSTSLKDCLYDESFCTNVLVCDVRNEGTVTAEKLLKKRFPCRSLTPKAESARSFFGGKFPKIIQHWSSFESEVLSCTSRPTLKTPHRTMFFDASRADGIYSRTVESALQNSQFVVFNELAQGQLLAIDGRLRAPVFGQPDFTISNYGKTLVPINIVRDSTLESNCDFISEPNRVFDKLRRCFPDQRWCALSENEKHLWQDTVQSSLASRAIMKIYGYSCANRTTYSIITTYNSWWFFKREKDGNVAVSAEQLASSQNPTIGECLNFIADEARFTSDCVSATSDQSLRSAIGTLLSSTKHAPPRNLNCPAVYICDQNGPILFDLDAVNLTKTTLEGLHGSIYRIDLCSADVALKVVDLYKQELEPLENELEIYNHLESCNVKCISRLCAYGTLGNGAFPFIGTEWCGRPLEEKDVLLFPKVVEAFEELHAAGVVHDDVRVDNILVDERTNEIKIIDFATSKMSKHDYYEEALASEPVMVKDYLKRLNPAYEFDMTIYKEQLRANKWYEEGDEL